MLNEELATVDSQLEDKVAELESTNNDLANLLSSTEIATLFIDEELRIRRFTEATTPLLGVLPSDVGCPIGDLAPRVNDPDLLEDARRVLRELTRIEREVRSQEGRWFLRRAVPYRTSENQVSGVVVTFSDVTSLKQTTMRLARREKQQASMAHLGQLALAERGLSDLFGRATRIVAETLECEFCKVLELSPDGQELFLRAGVGWKEGLVGKETVGTGLDSQGGFTLESRSPVIVRNLDTEQRFTGSRLLRDHGIVSGMSVALGSAEKPWGVLGVHAGEEVEFTEDDVNFMKVVGHILSSAIDREASHAGLRRARRELEERYLELETVYEQAPVGLAVIDADFRFVRVNATMAEINGVPAQQSVGKRIDEVLPAELAKRVEAELCQTLDSGHSRTDVEHLGATAAPIRGTRSWLASYHPVRRADESLGVICVVRETTASKRAAARTEAEHRVARILAKAEDLGSAMPGILEAVSDTLDFDAAEYWEPDAEGKRLRVGASFASDPGVEEAWRAAWPASGLARGECLVGRAWELERSLTSDELVEDARFTRRELARRLGFVSALALPIASDEDVVGVLSLFARVPIEQGHEVLECLRRIGDEISQALRRTQAEAAMRASEAIFRQTVEEAPIPIFLHAFDGEILTVNRAFAEATGYTQSDLPRKVDWMERLLRVPASEIPSRLRDLHRRLQTPSEFPEPEETDVFTRDGRKRRWRLYRCPPMRLANGREFATTMSVDLTDRVAAEAALEEAKESAEAASRLKSAFLANVSHEIRTPMTAILGYNDLLRDEVESDEARRMISIVRSNGLYLVRVIEDILDLSRIEADRLEIENERVEADRMVVEVASLMRAGASEKGLSLTVEFDDPIPESIQTDPTRLRQILINLVGNAVKFTEEGGVRIRTAFEPESNSLHIAVIDTGIGISRELQEKLFTPFFQGAPSRPYGGSGLGLTISRRLASLLGGDLTLSSEEGQGSTFTLTLPVAKVSSLRTVEGSDASGDLGDAEPEELPRLPLRILVVDDHPDVRELVTSLLERCGAQVSTSADGSEALRRCEEARGRGEPFDALVLDMQLPGLDGYEVARRLRATGFEGRLIALTAAAMREDRDRCLEAGCDHYLAKPVQSDELLKQIAAAPSMPSPEPDVEPRRILLVEDDADARAALSGLLKRRTHDVVRTAATAAEALEVSREWSPQVVLLDLTLPDRDGLELARDLRAAARTDVKLIALTGRTEQGIEEQVDAAGFDAMLRKPIQDIADLTRLFPDPAPA